MNKIQRYETKFWHPGKESEGETPLNIVEDAEELFEGYEADSLLDDLSMMNTNLSRGYNSSNIDSIQGEWTFSEKCCTGLKLPIEQEQLCS